MSVVQRMLENGRFPAGFDLLINLLGALQLRGAVR